MRHRHSGIWTYGLMTKGNEMKTPPKPMKMVWHALLDLYNRYVSGCPPVTFVMKVYQLNNSRTAWQEFHQIYNFAAFGTKIT